MAPWSLTRRSFLRFGSLPVVAPLVSLVPRSASDSPVSAGIAADAAPRSPAASDALDDALRLFQARAPESGGPGGRLSNHGPMVAEALETLARPDAIGTFAARYLPGLEPAPAPARPLAVSGWREALGRDTEFPRWLALFRAEIDTAGWRETTRLWSARLAPGLAGQATHGILRTGHAARALGRKDTAARRDELAHGLAYWASSYREVLPGRPVHPGSLKPSAALTRVPLLPAGQRITRGLIVGRMTPLAGFQGFVEAADLADSGADASVFLNDLCRTFAGVYLANTDTSPIILLHAVTGSSAVRLLLPHVDAAGRKALLAHAWRASAGFFSITALRYPASNPPDRESTSTSTVAPVPKPATLAEGAVLNGAVHAIKFTEACLREWSVAADPVLLCAAEDGVRRLDI
ncbi:MAG TPA: hypothetical protein VFQ07_13840 [Candidatus Polarisedimenticolia bacterium]|nr:hypothetical protein [Candidatus Polarisedimenticolia bacterium]